MARTGPGRPIVIPSRLQGRLRAGARVHRHVGLEGDDPVDEGVLETFPRAIRRTARRGGRTRLGMGVRSPVTLIARAVGVVASERDHLIQGRQQPSTQTLEITP